VLVARCQALRADQATIGASTRFHWWAADIAAPTTH
jgi:hypothetical protein